MQPFARTLTFVNETPVAERRTFETPRTLLFNSVVAAILATWLMIPVHELVHLVAARLNGFPAELYPFAVNTLGSPTNAQVAAEAISAPIFSLVTGFAMAFWTPLRSRGGFPHLLWIWFAFTSIMEGVGYLVITPFGAGDTAATADALGWPIWPRFVVMALGIGLQFLTAYLFAPHIGRHAGTEKSRTWAFAFWPWLIGTACSVALAGLYLFASGAQLGPGGSIAVLVGPVGVLVFAPMAFIWNRRFAAQTPQPLGLRPIPVAGIVTLIVLVAVNLTLLRTGMRIG